MHFVALATDYDGTLAEDGRVEPATILELKRLKAANKRLILITGRQIPDLKSVFDDLALFELIIAENGALLYMPTTREQRILGARPPADFIEALRRKNITPLSVGESIVATWTPHEQEVLSTIRELNLDWQLVFNKGAVMCLPPGINKASGLIAALETLNLSPHNVIGVGDAENDIAFLAVCGCAVAVANALEPVKAVADITLPAARGAGVALLARRWLDEPMVMFENLHRHELYLGGRAETGTSICLPSTDCILITGSSGAGKSRLTRLLIERISEAHYQLCVVDPESDFANLEHFSHLGDNNRTPTAEEVMGVLAAVQVNVALNLLATDIAQRTTYFAELFGRLSALRVTAGRPHWLVLDEAHHLWPRNAALPGIPIRLDSALLVSSRPDQLSREVLGAIGTVIVVGEQAPEVLRTFCALTDTPPPADPPVPGEDEVLLWTVGQAAVVTVRVGRARQPHARHVRKYAVGRLGDDISFYFRGPAATLNLKASNLAMFLEMARGVDDGTWLFHLHRGDYSRWFADVIKDLQLARETAALESSADASESREAIQAAIKRRYVIAGFD